MDYYISPNGIDSNPGTIASPLKTLDKGLNKAVAGDRIIMRGGTYRNRGGWFPEGKATVNNPITIEAYPGETVNISAFENLVGWEAVDLTNGKAIYKAPMPFTLCGESSTIAGEDFLVCDGTVLNEARWPPASIDQYPQPCNGWATVDSGRWISDPSVEKADVTAEIQDSKLVIFPTNALVGSYITILLGARWSLLSGKIVANDGNKLTFVAKSPGGDSFYRPDNRSLYFLFGSQQFLAYPGSWWREPVSNTVYVWLPDSSNPAKSILEAKKTNKLIDFWSRSYYSLENLNFIGASINISNASGMAFENCTFKWYSHRLYHATTWGWTSPALYNNRSGLRVSDCDFIDSMGSFSFPAGNEKTTIENCTMINAEGVDFGGANSRFSGNTVWNCPYGTLKLSNDITGLKLFNNDIGYGGKVFTDGGLLLVARTAVGSSAEVFNNYLHDGQGLADSTKEFYGTAGIYLEDTTAQVTFHHNVITRITSLGLNICGNLENISFFNNVFDASIGWWMRNRYPGCKYINNYAIKLNQSTQIHADMECRQNAFKDVLLPNNTMVPDAKFNPDYSLQQGSPLQEAGMVIESITSTNPPNIGAWEGNRELIGAVLRKKDLTQLQTRVTVIGSSVTVTLSNLPLGRKPSAEFSLQVGENVASRSGENEFLVENFVFTSTSQQILARINLSDDWLEIGATPRSPEIDPVEPPPAHPFVNVSPMWAIVGEIITLNGGNFESGAIVKFGTVLGIDTVVKSATQILAEVPQISGTVSVWVQNTNGLISNPASLTINQTPVPVTTPNPLPTPTPAPTPAPLPMPTQVTEPNVLCRAIGDRIECWDLNKDTWVLWVDRSVQSSENSQDVLVEIIRTLSVSLLAQANTISRLQSKIEALESTKSNLELTIAILRAHQGNIDSSIN
jgi:phage FluMu protein Com